MSELTFSEVNEGFFNHGNIRFAESGTTQDGRAFGIPPLPRVGSLGRKKIEDSFDWYAVANDTVIELVADPTQTITLEDFDVADLSFQDFLLFA